MDLSGVNLSQASFAGSTLLNPTLDHVFVDSNVSLTDYTNATIKFTGFVAAKRPTFQGIFRGTTIDGLRAAGGRVLNSMFEGSTLSEFILYMGVGVQELVGPQMIDTRFNDLEASGFSVNGGIGVLGQVVSGQLTDVTFKLVTLAPSQATYNSGHGFSKLEVNNLVIMDSSLMEFDFEDSVVEGLILDSVDWTDSRWEDLSIDTAAIHSLDGNIESAG